MITRILLWIVNLYRRFISPYLPSSCRFYPTCSCYAEQALRRHGALRGTLLTGRRLLRCHPLHPGGVDRVPDRVR